MYITWAISYIKQQCITTLQCYINSASLLYIKRGRLSNSAFQLIGLAILWFHCSFCPSWSFGSCRVAWGQFFRCSFSFANFLLDYLVLLSWLSCYLRFIFGHVRLFIALQVIRSHVCLIILLPTILSVALNQVFFFVLIILVPAILPVALNPVFSLCLFACRRFYSIF